MNITKSIYLSSVGVTFPKIMCLSLLVTYPLRDLNTSTLAALFKSVDLFYEKNMSDY